MVEENCQSLKKHPEEKKKEREVRSDPEIVKEAEKLKPPPTLVII